MRKVLFMSFAVLLVSAPVCWAQATTFDPPMLAGSRLHGKKDYEGAIAVFSKGLEADPNNASLYTLRARSRVKTHDLVNALADAEKAIALDKRSGGYLARAEVKEAKGDLDGALKDVDTAIEVSKPGAPSTGAMEVRLRLNRARKDDEGIVADLTYFISKEGESAFSKGRFKERAEAYRRLKKNDLAAADEAKFAELSKRKLSDDW